MEGMLKRKSLNILFTYLLLLAGYSYAHIQLPDIPDQHRQIILVTTQNWASPVGKLQLLERKGDSWTPADILIPVSVGLNGLAWGQGLHVNDTGAVKQEGDRKAPAGAFEVGTGFGYSLNAPEGVKIPYRQSTERDYFIDDVNSKDYNTWQTIDDSEENNPKFHWSSYERMKRRDHLYELGFTVGHNVAPVKKGYGSAIFFHVWRQADSATLGCTAVSKENLIKIMKWLDPELNPIVIQVPEKELLSIQFR